MPEAFLLAPEAVMAIALLALLLLYGLTMLIEAVAKMFTQAPFPITYLAGLIRSAESAVFGAMEGLFRSSLKAVGNLWRAIWETFVNLHQVSSTAHQAGHAAATRIVHVHIPQAQYAAEAFAALEAGEALSDSLQFTTEVETALSATIGDVYNAVNNEISQVYTTLGGAIGSLGAALGSDIDATISWATTEIRNVGATAEANIADLATWTSHSLGDVVATIDGEISTLGRWATTELGAVGAYAEQAAGQAETNAIGSLNASTAVAVAGIWPDVQVPAQDAIDSIAREYPETAPSLRSTTVAPPIDIAAAITEALAITIPLTTFVNECGIPMCDNLSTLVRGAEGLSTLLGAGVMLAALAAIIADPTGAAKATVDVADSIIDPVVSLVESVI